MLAIRELEDVLRRHVIDPWLPRGIDRAHGGFLCDFDIAWKDTGPHEKLAEFQARQTLWMAEAARTYPTIPQLRDAAIHGYRFLADVQWDREHGGWFHRVARDGTPLQNGMKHTHGFAYAIVACLAVHTLTGEREPLDLALDAADWIDRHAYDPTHGGYFGPMTRRGAVIRERDPAVWNQPVDWLGLALGAKDANISTDMLETLAMLSAATGGGTASTRLAELAELFVTRLIQPNGALPYEFAADWRPLPSMERTGYLLQGAHRLLRLAKAGLAPARAAEGAHRMIGHALAARWDKHRGGFREMGPHDGASEPAKVGKCWWDQWEGLRALFDAHDGGARPEYRPSLAAHWRFIRRHTLDNRNSGTFWYSIDDFGPWLRWVRPKGFAPRRPAKGEIWKDASHEARALMHCIAALRGAAA